MSFTLGSLTLGTVLTEDFDDIKRFAYASPPTGRGDFANVLGQDALQISLTGVFNNSSRYTYLQELNRIKNIGSSLKYDSPRLSTVVYILSVSPGKEVNLVLYYMLKLKSGKFISINTCDSIVDWTVDSGGGTRAVDTTYIKEGVGSLSLAGAIGAATASRLKYNPTLAVDIVDSNWVVFWFKISATASITSAYIKLYTDASNLASYNFSALITSTDWIRMRIAKSSFSQTGTVEWNNIDYLTIDVTKSGALTYTFYVDDLGAMQ